MPPASTTLWSNLCAGVESVGPFDEEDLLAAGAHTGDPNFVNSGAQMEDVDRFDAEFFGMGRREAELTDPQHRVVLEMAWAALEQAGYDPGTTERRIGIFGGVGRNQYFRHNLLTHPQMLERAGDHPVMLASEREYAILRAAFKLGLRGPAVNVNTACSTSGVATHLAIQSLLAGDSDMALAGGARVVVPRKAGYVYQEGSILSADGHVRAFDADARGTVIASGVAFIVLKRVDEAIEDGDTIYAVIRGSAINNDGSAKIGLTAPGIDGQAAVIEEALSVAEVDPATIGMVEAHGTGTLLGDPIEIAALTRAYRRQTDGRQYCSIGSLKSNIGHLDTALGRRRHHQGRALLAPRAHPSERQPPHSQPTDRFRVEPLLHAYRGTGVAGDRSATPGRRQLIRLRGHERPPRVGGGPASCDRAGRTSATAPGPAGERQDRGSP